MLILIATALAACVGGALEGFQVRVMASGSRVSVFGFGALIEVFELLVIAAIAAQANVSVFAMSALGAGLGWVVSMVIHDHLTRTTRKEEAMHAKRAFKSAVDKRIAKALRMRLNEEK